MKRSESPLYPLHIHSWGQHLHRTCSVCKWRQNFFSSSHLCKYSLVLYIGLGIFVPCLLAIQNPHQKGSDMSKNVSSVLRRVKEWVWFSCSSSSLKRRVPNPFCCCDRLVILQGCRVPAMTFHYADIRVYNTYVFLIPNKRGHSHPYIPTNMCMAPAVSLPPQKSLLCCFPDCTSHDKIYKASKSCADIAIIWKHPSGGTYWLLLWVDYTRDLS